MLKDVKKKVVAGATSVMVAIPGAMCFAAEPTGGDYASINKSMVDAFNTMVLETINGIGFIAPKAVLIFGCMFIWTKGKKFFTKVSA